MTVAVCLECGQLKSLAWKPCSSCHFQPKGIEALAKALIVSDHWVPLDRLKQFSARRRQGEPFAFDPDVVELFKAQVVRILPLTPDGELREIKASSLCESDCTQSADSTHGIQSDSLRQERFNP